MFNSSQLLSNEPDSLPLVYARDPPLIRKTEAQTRARLLPLPSLSSVTAEISEEKDPRLPDIARMMESSQEISSRVSVRATTGSKAKRFLP